ncbi:hypothetical protein D3C87_1958170 [compost metagenome]
MAETTGSIVQCVFGGISEVACAGCQRLRQAFQLTAQIRNLLFQSLLNVVSCFIIGHFKPPLELMLIERSRIGLVPTGKTEV